MTARLHVCHTYRPLVPETESSYSMTESPEDILVVVTADKLVALAREQCVKISDEKPKTFSGGEE